MSEPMTATGRFVVARALRNTAALIRNIADAATPGPWISHNDENCWSLHQRDTPYQILKAPKRDTPYAEYWPDEGTGRHIVSWSPGPARAVAVAMEAAAVEIELLPDGAVMSPSVAALCRIADAFQMAQPPGPDESGRLRAQLEELRVAQGIQPVADISDLAAGPEDALTDEEFNAYHQAIGSLRGGDNSEAAGDGGFDD